MFFRHFPKKSGASLYRQLPLAVFAFVMLGFIVQPHGAIRSGMLADTDDYMRLNEVINWLSGQGWHDLSHPRLDPGHAAIVHWARLLDLPLALLMLPFVKLMGMQNAALLASFIVPPVTFGLLLWLSVVLAKIFVGAEKAVLAPVMVLFAPLVLMNFAPGRVDHHGYEILVAGFGLLCLERMAEDERRGGWYAVAAAVVFACGLWIGTEALPWVILFVACLAALAAWRGSILLRRAAMFGIAFFLSTLAVFPLAVAPADYGNLALSWFSLADVVFAGLVAGMFGGVFVCNKIFKRGDAKSSPLGGRVGWGVNFLIDPPPAKTKDLLCKSKLSLPPPKGGGIYLRFAVTGMLASAATILFFYFVPDALHGPFADYDDFNSTIALASIGEAQPLIHALHFSLYNRAQNIACLINILQLLVLPLAGLLAIVTSARKAEPQRRALLLAHGMFLVVALALAVFWQMRIGWFMQFFAAAPLTYILVSGWEKVACRYQGRARFWAETALFLMLGFVPVVLMPALAHDAPLSDVILFPAARAAPACPLRAASDFLNSHYGDRPRIILSGANEGPELLFRTQHKVIAANFNVTGNEDVYNFFGARDDAAAQDIAKRRNADLVLVCRSFPLAYARLDHAHFGTTAFLAPAGDGKLHIVSSPDHLTLIERLVRGPIPPWLKPVEIPGDTDYLLFEVQY